MLITARNYRPQASLIFVLPPQGASIESRQIFEAFNNDHWLAIAKYEDRVSSAIHKYIEPLPEYHSECLPPQEAYKIKVRISRIRNGKPSI